MKKRIITFILCVLSVVTLIGGIQANAAAYDSYTYDISGIPIDSPDAYTPDRQVDAVAMGLEKSFYPTFIDPADMTVDKNGNVFIVDRGNVDVPGRVIMLDSNYKWVRDIGLSFFNDQGVPDSLSAPSGMFVSDDAIYVADTENKRIVVFDLEGNFDHIVLEPSSRLMGDDAIYKPVAVAVDAGGNLYVVSSTTYMGIIVMDKEGTFQCFLGAQKAKVDLGKILWRQFQTAEQIAQSEKFLPTEYNNITIDDEGFVYVTSSSITEAQQQASIMGKTGDYASVKKLNASGEDVMMRSGFFGPGGEVATALVSMMADENSITGSSRIIDVALGPDGTWSILDEKRSKIYTYDQYGRLLFVFGDTGEMLGNLKSGEALVYQGTKLLVLDKQAFNITVYERTEYGDIITNALRNSNARKYDQAVDDWNAILQRNGNFDIAYVGIGKAFYRSGDWEKAMEYFKYAYDTENYSLAFQESRKMTLSGKTWIIPNSIILVVIVVAAIYGLVKLFGWAGRVNKEATAKSGKRTFKEEVLYAFHLLVHPFDGFWDLKHEKRGSIRGAVFWLVLAVISFTYESVGTAYLFGGAGGTFISTAISLLLPVMLWVTSNWCLTTLFDGEGSYKDIFIATCYSLIPIPFFIIPKTILTHVFSLNEAGLISLLASLVWVWVGILVFFGMMITHGYSLFKNFVTVIATIVGIAVLMFVILLFTGLITKIIGFISSIVTELSFRT